jgi:hypothetical protein
MTRTPPVPWEEMVADPLGGATRILANQIADRDEEIALLRSALLLAREYVVRVHGTLVSAMGHENTLVKPDLDKIDAALSHSPHEQSGR